MNRKQEAFTLIELLVVLIILALVVAVIILPAIQLARQQAELQERTISFVIGKATKVVLDFDADGDEFYTVELSPLNGDPEKFIFPKAIVDTGAKIEQDKWYKLAMWSDGIVKGIIPSPEQ